MVYPLAVLVIVGGALGQMPPVPNPRHPTPLFSWDTVPIAFHGANRSGIYTGQTRSLSSQGFLTPL